MGYTTGSHMTNGLLPRGWGVGATKITASDNWRSPGAPEKARGAWFRHKKKGEEKKEKVMSKMSVLGTGVGGKAQKREQVGAPSVSSVPACP